MFTGAASDGIAIGDVQRVLRGRSQIFKIPNIVKSTDLGNPDTEDLVVDQRPNRDCLRAAALVRSRCCHRPAALPFYSVLLKIVSVCCAIVNNQLGFKK